jgi:hypothetical protein
MSFERNALRLRTLEQQVSRAEFVLEALVCAFGVGNAVPRVILRVVDLELTWLDPLFMLLLAGATVLGVRRGVSMLVVALGGIVAWLVLNILGLFLAPVGFLLALGAGYGLGLISRNLVNTTLESVNDSPLLAPLLGGLGGLMLGLGLVMALAVSFPTSPNSAAGQGRFFYPSQGLPAWLYTAVEKSAVQRFLRTSAANGGLGVWDNSSILRNLLVPDKAQSR